MACWLRRCARPIRSWRATIATRFDAVNAELATLKQGDAFPSYDTVDAAERRKLSQLVNALAEPLSQVAAKLSA